MNLNSLKYRLLLAGLVPFLSFCSGIEGEPTVRADEGQAAAPAGKEDLSFRMPVRVAPLTLQDVDDFLQLTGTARPWDDFEVSSEMAGRVTQIYVDEGDLVEKGQLLLELDREKRLIELQSRKAELARTTVVLEFAIKRLERGKALFEKGAISQAEVDSLDQEVQVAKTSVRLAEIAIESMEEEIEDTRIYSPADGQISRRSVSLGETVRPSAPLFSIIQVHPVKVVTEIAEPYLHKIREGQRVEVSFDAVARNSMWGTVHFIHPVASAVSGAFPTEIRLRNPNRLIQPGMVARVNLKAETVENALLAPSDAVQDREGRYFLFVVRDGVAYREEIDLVKRVGNDAIVEGPLEAGDLVVYSGAANLTDGTLVEVLS